MIKVLHFRNTAVLGRYPIAEISRCFSREGVLFTHEVREHKGVWKNPLLLRDWCHKNDIDWVYWGWEKEESSLYKKLFESDRKFKIFMFGQEQPQALNLIRQNRHFADVTITSSPVYKDEVDGFLPFGIHTYYFKEEKLPFAKKQDRILISGTYRHSRGQFFEWLLENQPFDWPVYLYPPRLHEDLVGRDRMRKIVSKYPKYVYKCASDHYDYIPNLLKHLNTHKLFLDFTTNSSNYLKFHEDLHEIMSKAKELKGGYCPERVLDALWLGTYSICFLDKAVEYVLQNHVEYFENLDELVSIVNALIRNRKLLKEKAIASQKFVEKYTTENVIGTLAHLFKTGEVKEL